MAGPGSHGGGLLAFTQTGREPAQPPLASNKGRDSRVETPHKPEMRLALWLSVRGLEVLGLAGKLQTARCFCPPNLSAMWETPPRNQPGLTRGLVNTTARAPRERKRPSARRGTAQSEKERKRNFQSSACWNPSAFFALRAPGRAECTYTLRLTRTCAHTHTPAPTRVRVHTIPHTHTQSTRALSDAVGLP